MKVHNWPSFFFFFEDGSMVYPNNTFDSVCEVISQVRQNLFHAYACVCSQHTDKFTVSFYDLLQSLANGVCYHVTIALSVHIVTKLAFAFSLTQTLENVSTIRRCVATLQHWVSLISSSAANGDVDENSFPPLLQTLVLMWQHTRSVQCEK